MADSSTMAFRIRKQIEFYFSDSNFRQDKFLREKASQNADGFVPLEIIAGFNRVKSLTNDMSQVVSALKDSSSLVLSEDEKSVRRSDPLPEEDKSLNRSIYVKRFPLDSTLDELTEFFSQFGPVNCIRMRRMEHRGDNPNVRPFKGSIIVEFANEETAAKVVAMKDLVFPRNESIKASGVGEAKEGEKKEYVPEPWSGPLYIVTKEEFMKEEDSKRKKDPKQTAGTKRKANDEPDFPKGCLVLLKNIGEIDRFKIKELFEAQGNAVSFVELLQNEGGEGEKDGEKSEEKGEEKPRSAIVRMSSADGAKQSVQKLTEGKVEFGGQLPEFSFLEGAEEEEYWKKISDKGKGRGRGGRGGRGRGRGHKRQRK